MKVKLIKISDGTPYSPRNTQVPQVEENLIQREQFIHRVNNIVSSARNETTSCGVSLFYTVFVASGHFVESPLGEEKSGKQNVDANNVASRPDDVHIIHPRNI